MRLNCTFYKESSLTILSCWKCAGEKSITSSDYWKLNISSLAYILKIMKAWSYFDNRFDLTQLIKRVNESSEFFSVRKKMKKNKPSMTLLDIFVIRRLSSYQQQSKEFSSEINLDCQILELNYNSFLTAKCFSPMHLTVIEVLPAVSLLMYTHKM